jgi:hypothetical protein
VLFCSSIAISLAHLDARIEGSRKEVCHQSAHEGAGTREGGNSNRAIDIVVIDAADEVFT